MKSFTIDELPDRAEFLSCLSENLEAVVDGLRAIEAECSLAGESNAAEFVHGLAVAIGAFSQVHVPLTWTPNAI